MSDALNVEPLILHRHVKTTLGAPSPACRRGVAMNATSGAEMASPGVLRRRPPVGLPMKRAVVTACTGGRRQPAWINLREQVLAEFGNNAGGLARRANTTSGAR